MGQTKQKNLYGKDTLHINITEQSLEEANQPQDHQLLMHVKGFHAHGSLESTDYHGHFLGSPTLNLLLDSPPLLLLQAITIDCELVKGIDFACRINPRINHNSFV
jgi:hypothetical protein